MGSAELRTELENRLQALNIEYVSVEHPEVIRGDFVCNKKEMCTEGIL